MAAGQSPQTNSFGRFLPHWTIFRKVSRRMTLPWPSCESSDDQGFDAVLSSYDLRDHEPRDLFLDTVAALHSRLIRKVNLPKLPRKPGSGVLRFRNRTSLYSL